MKLFISLFLAVLLVSMFIVSCGATDEVICDICEKPANTYWRCMDTRHTYLPQIPQDICIRCFLCAFEKNIDTNYKWKLKLEVVG